MNMKCLTLAAMIVVTFGSQHGWSSPEGDMEGFRLDNPEETSFHMANQALNAMAFYTQNGSFKIMLTNSSNVVIATEHTWSDNSVTDSATEEHDFQPPTNSQFGAGAARATFKRIDGFNNWLAVSIRDFEFIEVE